MSLNNRETGILGEEIAAKHLTSIGFEILIRNYRTRFGEVDIIASDGCCISFVEVKCRHSLVFGSPCEAVNFKKQQKLKSLASCYILAHCLSGVEARFDIVEILLDKRNQPLSIELIRNAFE